jgi:hypothetical protein
LDEVVDLVVHRRNGTGTLGVQVKAHSTTTSRVVQRDPLIANVRPITFRSRLTLWMLFISVDRHGPRQQRRWTAGADPAWLAGIKVMATDLAESFRAGLSPGLDHARCSPIHFMSHGWPTGV